MSDALPDRPVGSDGPPPAAPRPAPDSPAGSGVESLPSLPPPEAGPAATSIDTPARRRRRGSRGGRNRSRSSGTAAVSGAGSGSGSGSTDASGAAGNDGHDDYNDDDDNVGGDNDGGGPPTLTAVERPAAAETPGVAPDDAVAANPAAATSVPRARPKIGDSRPAPAPAAAGPQSGGSARAPSAGGGGTGRGANRGGRARDGGGRNGAAGAPKGSAGRTPGAAGTPAAPGVAGASDPVRSGGRSGLPPRLPVLDGDDGDQSWEDGSDGRRRRRRAGRAGRGPVGAGAGVDNSDEIDAETLERRKGRERKGRPVGRYLMLVHVQPNATQIAVLEGRSLIEHYVSRPADDATQIDGNIYLGRVQNVLPGMEAAFVDIGTPKNAVLYRGDVRYDRDDLEGDAGGGKPTRGRGGGQSRDARIEQLLKVGQTIVCQVTKNPIGTKGARLSQEVSLPGRFVVLIPGSDTYGISKRLADEERKRLRRILDDIRPAGHGLIVRTAAEGASADELRRDVARLLRQWDEIDTRAKRAKSPALLYREPDMAVRVIREEFNTDYRGVVIDDPALFEEVRDYVASISPDLADRVEFAGDSDSPLPIFERYHVHEQVHKALDRKVWLPSGGSLIIERTEALTVIDVNTGKNVGTSNLEETVFRNNLEAAEEIARQLRLRDIGGIIVIDFIDMEIAANRAEVARAFREALARDKTRTQVFDISELGLIEMTRKRVSEGLVESFSETCPTCGGRGLLLDEELL
ncbi:MAG: ribonuclease [Acidimicrobiaceae bacterium]|nr:ribonuclease [Acidimicrobiaceae bacterium]